MSGISRMMPMRGKIKLKKKHASKISQPMEVVQKYMNTFYKNMDQLNTLHPSIERRASWHIIEQIEFIKTLIKRGYAYESNGSVYFDILKYNQKHSTGKSFRQGSG